TCISEFYYKKNSKISYYKWLLLWTIVSTIVSIFGLNNILSFTIPLLLLMNPITIWIIFLTLTDKIFDGDILVYRYTTYVVCSFSLLSILPKLGLNLEVINIILSYIPFSKYEFAWFIPTFTLYILLIIRKRLYFIKK
ncbi:branched-chain amino acid transport system II carrier protein, partial [Pseudostreptobacillus sp.]